MNSPLASTASIASRRRGRSGAYWALTSTSGIGGTGRKSRSSPSQSQICGDDDHGDDDCVLHVAEVVVEVFVAPAGAPADACKRKGPDRRADGRQQRVRPERQAEDPRGERGERGSAGGATPPTGGPLGP